MAKREKQIHFRVSSTDYRELKVCCALKDSSLQEYLTRLVDENLMQKSANTI